MGFAKVRESIEPYYQHWLNPSMQGCSVASVYEKLQPVSLRHLGKDRGTLLKEHAFPFSMNKE